MARATDSLTRITLLQRLQGSPADAAAWAEFVDQYAYKVLGWCRKWGLQDADAEDVTQDVMLRLAAKMRDFVYDPSRSFRAWLKTVTRNAYSDFVASQQRPGRGSGDTDVARWLHTAEAREDLVRHLEEAFDRELLEAAMARVRLRVEAHTWEAFRLLTEGGLSGAEAAGRLGMKVATVFVAKSKVQKMIQQEVRRLDGPAPEDE
jgi:RNA polymerase sigma-70 factor (ECF subfamily)